MSFILDALKKSENERQQQSGGEFSAVPSSPAGSRPVRWFGLLAALLAINVAVLLGILMRPDVSPAPATTFDATEPQALPAAAAPASTPSFEDRLEQVRREQPAASAETTATAVPPATPAAVPPTRAPANTSGGRIPTIEELRLDGSLQLPELHIDIHVYSENPDERFVFINMAKQRENSQLDEGPVVREITAEGVILQYQGRSFLLSRE